MASVVLSRRQAARWFPGHKVASRQPSSRPPFNAEDPQCVLSILCEKHFPNHAPRLEYSGSVPGRKFRIDIAFPDQRLGIEVDGWRFHRSLSAHHQDRIRQNLLVIHGWRMLRFTTGQILKAPDECLEIIFRALNG